MDARLCGEVRAADKRGARGVGGDGSPPKNAGHMWRCAAALSHRPSKVFCTVINILGRADVTATDSSRGGTIMVRI